MVEIWDSEGYVHHFRGWLEDGYIYFIFEVQYRPEDIDYIYIILRRDHLFRTYIMEPTIEPDEYKICLS